MRQLEYRRPADASDAVALVSGDPDAAFLAGGSNLVDHLKLGVASPGLLVDVTRLPLDTMEVYDDRLRVGANVRNSDLAAHPVIRARYPVVARALLAGASGQIRHQATTAGNLLQRTRCVYFQDVTTPCNKRDPGSGCSAVEGYGRYNAILGTSPECVAVHPSDLAVALSAVDAVAVVLGADGERRIQIADLHRLPGDRPDRDTVLQHGDLITAVELPRLEVARWSTYHKVRDRASYAFALVSVAAALELDGDGAVRDVRLAWGGVAHKPWRASRVEVALRGQQFTTELLREAMEEELAAAVTGEENEFKVSMVRNTTEHVLEQLALQSSTRGATGGAG
ncbi:MAG TPA: xanthine dehydrogenase family protein subunit M [Nocardioides sp.]|uniref:FAD binding domain-containing protein n=1 Tax=Nocardioides sp. TaxID=35761 RepID=UPI002F4262CA